MARFGLMLLVLAPLLAVADEPRPARLRIVTSPEAAAITIDGHLAGLSPRDEVLAPGVHTLVAELAGAPTLTQTFSLAEGEVRTLKLAFSSGPGTATPFPVAGLVTGLAGGAALTVGLLLRFAAEDAARQVNALTDRGGGWDQGGQQREAAGLRAQTWSWFFTGAGSALLASGLVVLVLQLRGPGLPTLTLVPTGGGAFVSGSFAW